MPMSLRNCLPSKSMFAAAAYAFFRASATVFPFAQTLSTLPPFVFSTPFSRFVPAWYKKASPRSPTVIAFPFS